LYLELRSSIGFHYSYGFSYFNVNK
jgi:hypothetical protein